MHQEDVKILMPFIPVYKWKLEYLLRLLDEVKHANRSKYGLRKKKTKITIKISCHTYCDNISCCICVL